MVVAAAALLGEVMPLAPEAIDWDLQIHNALTHRFSTRNSTGSGKFVRRRLVLCRLRSAIAAHGRMFGLLRGAGVQPT